MPQLESATFISQIVWLAVTFLALYVVMARIALPRIGEVLEARQDRIAHDLDTAASLKAEAEAALAAYETSIAEARISAAKREALGNIAELAGEIARAATAKLIGVEPGDDEVKAALAQATESEA